jgi:hypothetical protein
VGSGRARDASGSGEWARRRAGAVDAARVVELRMRSGPGVGAGGKAHGGALPQATFLKKVFRRPDEEP